MILILELFYALWCETLFLVHMLTVLRDALLLLFSELLLTLLWETLRRLLLLLPALVLLLLDLQSDFELRVLRRTEWPRIEPRIRTIAA